MILFSRLFLSFTTFFSPNTSLPHFVSIQFPYFKMLRSSTGTLVYILKNFAKSLATPSGLYTGPIFINLFF